MGTRPFSEIGALSKKVTPAELRYLQLVTNSSSLFTELTHSQRVECKNMVPTHRTSTQGHPDLSASFVGGVGVQVLGFIRREVHTSGINIDLRGFS